MGELDGKVAVVTGGSLGIGRATVQRLATEGAAQTPAAHRITLNTGKSILDGIRAQMNEMNARLGGNHLW